MSPGFIVEVVAYAGYVIGSTAAGLAVFGLGPKRLLNRLFGLFTFFGAVWGGSAILLRFALLLEIGNPTFWLEMAAMSLNFMAPVLLLFAIRYVGRPTRWVDRVAGFGFLLIAASSILVYRHQLLANPVLDENGLVSYWVSTIGRILPLVAATLFLWASIIFWRARETTGESYLAVSTLILVVGFVAGGILRDRLPYPIMSILVTVSVGVLDYGVFTRQLLNPMTELTAELENRVAERTKELMDAATRLETVNVALARRSEQFEAAAQVAREAAAIRDVGHLLSQTVNLISDRFGFYHAGIFLLDEAGEYAVLRAASSDGGQTMLLRGYKLRVGDMGLVGSVALSGAPRIALDVGVGATQFTNPDLPDTRSEIGLPLKVRETVIGVLDVQSMESEAFSEEDATILQTLADQVTLAIQNARLLVETQDRLRETHVLLGHQSQEGWTRMIGDQSWIYAYDGVEVVSGEVAQKTETEPKLNIPLEVRGDVIGHVDLILPNRSPSSEEIALAEAVVEQASLALESSRLFQETQNALGETEVLYRASAALSEAQSYGDVLDTLLQHTLVGKSDRCAITRFDTVWTGRTRPQKLEIEAVWDTFGVPLFPTGMRFDLSLFPALEQIRPDTPVIITDVENDSRLDLQTRVAYLHNLRARAVLLVPLLIGGSAFGWIVTLYEQPTEFSSGDLRLLTSLSGQAAVTVQSLRLLEAAQRRAEQERLVAEITTQVRASNEVDTILRTAIRELGRALRVSDGTIRLEMDAPQIGKGPAVADHDREGGGNGDMDGEDRRQL